jgi:pilus assembly protein CpaC
MNSTIARTLRASAPLLLLAMACAAPVAASDAPAIVSDPYARALQANGGESALRFVALGIGKSVVIDLPRDAKDVLVANPAIANAVVRSTRRAYLIGVAIGQTNVFFFDAEGRQIAGFDIAVTRDLNGMRAALRQMLPGVDIRVEGLGDGVVLSGSAANAIESQQAFDLATKLVGGDPNKVANSIVIRGRDQVMLKVTVAEVQRDVVKQLGINLNASLGYGNSVLNFNTSNPFSANGGALSDTAATGGWINGVNPNPINGAPNPAGTFKNNVTATVQAMERAGVIRTLAEPNLTAISGESATFLAGGEFPIPSGRTCDPATGACTTTITFKKFGIGLNFTPVVLSEGRISLKVSTEVSELSNEGALVQAGLSIPSLRVRRADTTVEIPSGGALAMAGLIQEQTKQVINGVPGLLQVPVLGALFKSRDYVNRQTELMVLVTPYVVRAVAPKDLSRPDDGFADPSDPSSNFLSKLNRIYGPTGKADPRRAYHGAYGYILD